MVDTIIAQLEALIIFCEVVQGTLDYDQFTYIKERGNELMVKLEALLEDLPQCEAEALLPKANFNVSLADFRIQVGNHIGTRIHRICSGSISLYTH